MIKKIILIFSLFFAFFVSAQNNRGDIFSQEYICHILNKTAEWQLAHPKHEPNDWTNGVFYAGLYSAWKTTHSDNLYKSMITMGNGIQWQPGKRWYHADDIAISQTFVDLYRIEKNWEMIQPTIDTLALYISRSYPVKGWEIIKWWWCDALFMAPPTFVKLGITLKNPIYLEFSDLYFQECYDLLYDKEEFLFARALNYVIQGKSEDKYEANGEKIFWSRGNGWVIAGLAKILEELPKDYYKCPFYEQLFTEMCIRLVELQPEDGLWRTSLLDPDSYPHGEVSGSSLFCYAMAWGINNGLLDMDKYLPVVNKTWKSLNECIHENGMIGWVQPIGANPQKNFSGDNWEVYGTGAFLMAGSEMAKVKQ